MTYTLVTCSGVSNTGKLTTQAAQVLLQRQPGRFAWVHAKQSAGMLGAELGSAETVIVLDGCTDCCATKNLEAAGHTAGCHIIATELGIEKRGMGEVQYGEIESVISAVIRYMHGG